MVPAEMQPLLKLMDQTEKRLAGRQCDDVVEALAFYRTQVKNDFSAKAACREIGRMCGYSQWGRRLISGMDYADWILLLKDLKAASDRALSRIEARQAEG